MNNAQGPSSGDYSSLSSDVHLNRPSRLTQVYKQVVGRFTTGNRKVSKEARSSSTDKTTQQGSSALPKSESPQEVEQSASLAKGQTLRKISSEQGQIPTAAKIKRASSILRNNSMSQMEPSEVPEKRKSRVSASLSSYGQDLLNPATAILAQKKLLSRLNFTPKEEAQAALHQILVDVLSSEEPTAAAALVTLYEDLLPKFPHLADFLIRQLIHYDKTETSVVKDLLNELSNSHSNVKVHFLVGLKIHGYKHSQVIKNRVSELKPPLRELYQNLLARHTQRQHLEEDLASFDKKDIQAAVVRLHNKEPAQIKEFYKHIVLSDNPEKLLILKNIFDVLNLSQENKTELLHEFLTVVVRATKYSELGSTPKVPLALISDLYDQVSDKKAFLKSLQTRIDSYTRERNRLKNEPEFVEEAAISMNELTALINKFKRMQDAAKAAPPTRPRRA